jgi:hypothetical protein
MVAVLVPELVPELESLDCPKPTGKLWSPGTRIGADAGMGMQPQGDDPQARHEPAQTPPHDVPLIAHESQHDPCAPKPREG